MFGTKKTLRDFWISHSRREFSISEIIFRTARKPNRFTTGEAFKKLKSMQAFAIFVKNENCKQTHCKTHGNPDISEKKYP